MRFEEYFLTPPDLDLPALCAAAGARYVAVDSWPGFRSALKEGLRSEGVSLLHLPIDREANLAHFRALVAAAGAAARP